MSILFRATVSLQYVDALAVYVRFKEADRMDFSVHDVRFVSASLWSGCIYVRAGHHSAVCLVLCVPQKDKMWCDFAATVATRSPCVPYRTGSKWEEEMSGLKAKLPVRIASPRAGKRPNLLVTCVLSVLPYHAHRVWHLG
jgi:hypothetical protein